MIGLGVVAAAGAAALLWVSRRGRLPRGKAWVRLALAMPLLPLAANSFGWIFTEMGRQPWVVFGLMPTRAASPPASASARSLTSVITLTLLYAVLAVIEVGLLLKYVRQGADPFVEPPNPQARRARRRAARLRLLTRDLTRRRNSPWN